MEQGKVRHSVEKPYLFLYNVKQTAGGFGSCICQAYGEYASIEVLKAACRSFDRFH